MKIMVIDISQNGHIKIMENTKWRFRDERKG